MSDKALKWSTGVFIIVGIILFFIGILNIIANDSNSSYTLIGIGVASLFIGGILGYYWYLENEKQKETLQKMADDVINDLDTAAADDLDDFGLVVDRDDIALL